MHTEQGNKVGADKPAVAATDAISISSIRCWFNSVSSVQVRCDCANLRSIQLIVSIYGTWIRKRKLLRKLSRPHQQQRLKQRSLSQWVMLSILSILGHTWRSSSPSCLSTARHTGSHRTSLSDELFENLVLLKKNKNLFK